jgi:hypothetical protein
MVFCCDLDRARDRSLALVDTLGDIIIKREIITAESSAAFVQARNTLDGSLLHPGEPPQAALQRLELALEGLKNALELPPPARCFTLSDARQSVELLTHTQRILECREAAERVTQASWDQVCEQLVAPPTPLRWSLRSILRWIGLRRN